ncbi:LysM peptidoglycan-binding domain-containing protein [Litorilinea aerophila]|uniref:LysM peptidoglycan-binding domain-containing protein n=1 Tax=Litorilinea aerophila TaxID=1204385 RepID=A0A540VK71_9CHLR|nr:LysM domain-containing protein [Litorilinea aerophila]MCC9075253.1 LysM peptidoglycan-binding domain-containing protein [Litorilinea aerophila]
MWAKSSLFPGSLFQRIFSRSRLILLTTILTLSLIGALLPASVLAAPTAGARSKPPAGNRFHPVHPGKSAQCAQIYVVRHRDTLSEIARKFGTTVEVLQRINRIRNPHRIFVGQRLCIPRVEMPPPPEHKLFHRVQAGETLSEIAQMYRTTVRQLLRLNPQIRNPHRIPEGAILRVR